MSHVVTIETKITDPLAVQSACQRLNFPQPVLGTAQLYSGEVTGLIVQLPQWRYPIVIDTLTGNVHYDNFGGRWGEESALHKFLQAYAVEKTRLEARKKGMLVSESTLADGSIKLDLRETN